MHKKTLVFFWMSANSRTDIKGKVHPKKGHKGPEVEQVCSSTLLRTR
jgi:hypothetical protein